MYTQKTSLDFKCKAAKIKQPPKPTKKRKFHDKNRFFFAVQKIQLLVIKSRQHHTMNGAMDSFERKKYYITHRMAAWRAQGRAGLC
jgi:hypothetical protein